MSAGKWPNLTVSKLDGARRQIEVAVSMWFADADEVCLRMLTGNAHQVCQHILLKSGKAASPILFNESIWPPDEWRAFKVERKAENFFKHADEDPDPAGLYTFRPEVTRWYLKEAVEMFHTLNGSISLPMRAFSFRSQLDYPKVFPQFREKFGDEIAIHLRGLSKTAFLQKCLQEFALRDG